MYWFDTTILALLAISALLGAWSGLVGQLARIVCVSLSCYASVLLHEPVVGLLEENLFKGANQLIINLLAYAIVFLMGYLVLHYVARLIRSLVREADLEGYDRLFGSLLGTGKMALMIGVVCLGMMNYRHPMTESILEKSKLAGFFGDNMERIVVMVPEDYKARLKETVLSLGEQTIDFK